MGERIETYRIKKMLICEDCMEGIFSAVYDGWKYGNGYEVRLNMGEPQERELFTE